MILTMRRLAAFMIPGLGYGRCYHCKLPWSIVEPHELDDYRPGRSLFLTCTWCWPRTTSHQRLGYLRHLLWVVWARSTPNEELEQIYDTLLPSLCRTPEAVQ